MPLVPKIKTFFSVTCFLICGCFSAFAADRQGTTNYVEPARSSISVISIGPPKTIYDTGRDGCDNQDTPDAPARAFRDTIGRIHFFATGSINRAMVGDSLFGLKHSCEISYQARKSSNPADYNDNGWLTGFYANGSDVFALVHNEFHGSERKDFCPPGKGKQNCIEVSITAAKSTNGGETFARITENGGLIAALPYRFKPKPGQFFGLMNPSNIVRRGEFYYALVSQIDPYQPGRSGVCVIRTKDLNSPTSWRAWDGSAFTVRFINPYTTESTDNEAHVCHPLADKTLFFSVGNISWVPQRQSYIVVMRRQRWDRALNDEVPGAYLSESQDLIHWGKPILLLSDKDAGGVDQLYPAILDPNSPDTNFTSVSSSVILYTKVSRKGFGYAGWDLVARRLKLRF